MTPRLPDPDDREPPPSGEARDMATLLALVAVLGVALGLIFLVAMVLPDALWLILAALVIPLYFVFHYVVWGRLMTRLTKDETPSDPE